MAIKIDIKKAFDSMSWPFIMEVLSAFGFHKTFCDWIMAIFQSARISILLPGGAKGYFPCSRGVRQRDPLSPLLFCLAEDFLSRLLTRRVNDGKFLPIATARYVAPSHLLYADDVLIFGRASRQNLKALKDLFRVYGQLSGQEVT